MLHDPVLWQKVDLTACSSCITDAAVDRILASASDIESLVLRPPASPPHLSWKLVQGLVAAEACKGLRELRLDGCSGLLANTPKHLRPHISEAGVRCRIPAHLCFSPLLEDETGMEGQVRNGELDDGGRQTEEGEKESPEGTRSGARREEEGGIQRGSAEGLGEGLDEVHSIECVFADWVRGRADPFPPPPHSPAPGFSGQMPGEPRLLCTHPGLQPPPLAGPAIAGVKRASALADDRTRQRPPPAHNPFPPRPCA